MQMLHYVSRLGDKLVDLAHYPAAWIGGVGLFIADAFTGGRLVVDMVVIVSVIDLVCGIAVAISKKEFTRSELMRQTVEKLLIYGFVLLVFICVDSLIEKETGFTTDITSGLIGVVITLTEAVSFTASLLILFPKNAFLQMFQKMLKGELARKLNCEVDEVDSILAKARNKRKPKRDKNGRFIKSK